MTIFEKIKSFFGEPKTAIKSEKEFLNRVFQDYLKIRTELQVSDVKLNGNINFKVNYQGSIVPFWLAIEVGISQAAVDAKIQDALTKIALGIALGLNLVEISQTLKETL